MKSKETSRFLKTFEATAPRRKAYYQRPDRTDEIIAQIKIELSSGRKMTSDIFLGVNKIISITKRTVIEILKFKEGELWTSERGPGTTIYYQLMENQDETNK